MDVVTDEDNISMVLPAHNAMDHVSAHRRRLEPHHRVRPKATTLSTSDSGREVQDRWSATAMSSFERSSDFPLLPSSDVNFPQQMWLSSPVTEGPTGKRSVGRPAEAPTDHNSAFGLLGADSYPSSASQSMSDAPVRPSDLMTFGGSHGCPGGKGWDLHGTLYENSIPFSAKTLARSPPRNNLRDPEWVAPSPKQDSLTSSSEGHGGGRDASRESRMVLEHVQPDLVERVLSLVLTSDSAIDVKICGQDSTDQMTT